MLKPGRILFVVLLIASVKPASAQITFPKGNSIDTVSGSLLMYFETQVIFNTHKFKVTDYSWQKISDSLDNRWLVTACFNGDCRDSLLWQGNFISDYGYNDSTCFLAFHVESHGNTGISAIKYKVYNRNNPADSGIISVRVRYINLTGIEKINTSSNAFSVYPNPVSDEIFIETPNNSHKIYTVTLYDLCGKKIDLEQKINFDNKNNCLISLKELNLSKGMYLLGITKEEQATEMHKIMIR